MASFIMLQQFHKLFGSLEKNSSQVFASSLIFWAVFLKRLLKFGLVNKAKHLKTHELVNLSGFVVQRSRPAGFINFELEFPSNWRVCMLGCRATCAVPCRVAGVEWSCTAKIRESFVYNSRPMSDNSCFCSLCKLWKFQVTIEIITKRKAWQQVM